MSREGTSDSESQTDEHEGPGDKSPAKLGWQRLKKACDIVLLGRSIPGLRTDYAHQQYRRQNALSSAAVSHGGNPKKHPEN